MDSTPRTTNPIPSGADYGPAPRSLEPSPLASSLPGSGRDPVQLRSIDLVDTLTKLAHLVSPDELMVGHQRGITRRCVGSGSGRRAWWSRAVAGVRDVRRE